MPSAGWRQWKLDGEKHGRTFLRSSATFRHEHAGQDEHGDVAFWGEWEGAARLVTELAFVPPCPRWLCLPEPDAAHPPSDRGIPPQNTDPFVWGDAIRYTYCRQKKNGRLRRLGRGSLILFGSSLRKQFVLDTVLVVAGWAEHRMPEDLDGLTDEEHMRATIEPMYGYGAAKRSYRLYFGATPAEPVDGMFSFVPCRPVSDGKVGFARPVIELDGLINPNRRQQAAMLDVPGEGIPGVWKTVVDVIGAEGLALATRLGLE